MSENDRASLLVSKATACITRYASRDESRPILTGVLVTNDEVVATDSYRLGIVTLPRSEQDTPADFPHVNGEPVATSLDAPVVLPAKAIADAVKNIPKTCLPILANVALRPSEDGHTVGLVTTDLKDSRVVTARVIEGEYPSYKRLLPDPDSFVASVALNYGFLADVCAAAKVFDGAKSTPLILHLQASPYQPCILTMHNAYTGQDFTTLLMPVPTNSDEEQACKATATRLADAERRVADLEAQLRAAGIVVAD